MKVLILELLYEFVDLFFKFKKRKEYSSNLKTL